jgi:hypothetical protein
MSDFHGPASLAGTCSYRQIKGVCAWMRCFSGFKTSIGPVFRPYGGMNSFYYRALPDGWRKGLGPPLFCREKYVPVGPLKGVDYLQELRVIIDPDRDTGESGLDSYAPRWIESIS